MTSPIGNIVGSGPGSDRAEERSTLVGERPTPIEALWAALDAVDAANDACPIPRLSCPERCPKCGATSSQNCGPNVSALDGLARTVRAFRLSGAALETQEKTPLVPPSDPPSPYLQAKLEASILYEALRWIELFADMRSKDDSKVFARVNRGALRTIAERARSAIASVESGGKDKITGDTNG